MVGAAMAMVAGTAWVAVGVGLVAFGVSLAGEHAAAPPLGLALVAVAVPIVLAGAAIGMVVARRVQLGRPGAVRLARWVFGLYAVVAVITVPGETSGGFARLVELALLVVSLLPIVLLLAPTDQSINDATR